MRSWVYRFIAGLFFLALGNAQGALYDRGGGLIYDDDLDITWLANANLGASNSFGLAYDVDLGAIPGVTTLGGSVIHFDGRMSWGGALKWIDAMNNANYLGHGNWRMPNSPESDLFCQVGICYASEMGHLFYHELGGVEHQIISATHNANYDLFQNIIDSDYWSGAVFPLDNGCTALYGFSDCQAWHFSFYYGSQSANPKFSWFYVMAVHDGDIGATASPIPEPETHALMLTGLGLVWLAARRRRQSPNF